MTHPTATPIDLDELERLAKAATPGPWHSTRLGDVSPEDEHDPLICEPMSDADAAFIASANPSTILALITEVRALRARWRTCADVIPDGDTPVLRFWSDTESIDIGWTIPSSTVTHWMGLPTPPEER